MGQLMCDDGLDGTQVSLHGNEMAATCVDVHAAASRELTCLWVEVSDVPVVGVVIVEDDEDVVAPLGYMGDTIKNAHDPLQRLVDKRERGFGNVLFQCGQKQGGAMLAQPVLRPKGDSEVLEPCSLACRPGPRLRCLTRDPIDPLLSGVPVKPR